MSPEKDKKQVHGMIPKHWGELPEHIMLRLDDAQWLTIIR
jgi:hypothetical protein